MTLTNIEKAAKLMKLSYKVSGDIVWIQYDTSKREFNPRTNKVDLMDLECELGIDIEWNEAAEYVHAIKRTKHREYVADKYEYFSSHNNDKFTAKAHAVMVVVEHIYDRREG